MEDVRNLSRKILELSTQGVIRRKHNDELKNPYLSAIQVRPASCWSCELCIILELL
jgi:predicted transcriptional regulator